MILKNNYVGDFRKDKSINSRVGFDSKLYTSGFNESENMVNILTINSIQVNIDINAGSYVIGSTQPTIHSFFVMPLPGINYRKSSKSSLPSNTCRHDSWHHHLANRSE